MRGGDVAGDLRLEFCKRGERLFGTNEAREGDGERFGNRKGRRRVEQVDLQDRLRPGAFAERGRAAVVGDAASERRFDGVDAERQLDKFLGQTKVDGGASERPAYALAWKGDADDGVRTAEQGGRLA